MNGEICHVEMKQVEPDVLEVKFLDGPFEGETFTAQKKDSNG